MKKIDGFELEIKSALDELIEHKYEIMKGATGWTLGVKEVLGKLGEQKGYGICAAGTPEYEAEWLYDMVWYKEKSEGEATHLSSIPFVMESEWNMDFYQIKYDFEKLLLANADHRLMICYVHPDNMARMKSYFKEAVQSYKQGRINDRFLIAVLNYYTDEFEYQLVIKE